MADEEVWGPWIEHDGKGCPCEGRFVHFVRRDGRDGFGFAGSQCRANGYSANSAPSAWVWADCPGYKKDSCIIRYRIRKPKGLTILESIIADLPAPTNPKVDA